MGERLSLDALDGGIRPSFETGQPPVLVSISVAGSATILEVALKMARTPTLNQLRYIWFGGEEINLLGSAFYTKNLTPAQEELTFMGSDEFYLRS